MRHDLITHARAVVEESLSRIQQTLATPGINEFVVALGQTYMDVGTLVVELVWSPAQSTWQNANERELDNRLGARYSITPPGEAEATAIADSALSAAIQRICDRWFSHRQIFLVKEIDEMLRAAIQPALTKKRIDFVDIESHLYVPEVIWKEDVFIRWQSLLGEYESDARRLGFGETLVAYERSLAVDLRNRLLWSLQHLPEHLGQRGLFRLTVPNEQSISHEDGVWSIDLRWEPSQTFQQSSLSDVAYLMFEQGLGNPASGRMGSIKQLVELSDECIDAFRYVWKTSEVEYESREDIKSWLTNKLGLSDADFDGEFSVSHSLTWELSQLLEADQWVLSTALSYQPSTQIDKPLDEITTD